MQDSGLIISVIGALITALYFFIRKDFRKQSGNGGGIDRRLVQQIKDLHDWHSPVNGQLKWYSDRGSIETVKEEIRDMRVENIKSHLEVVKVLEMIVNKIG